MTRLIPLSLCAALALTPALASAQNLIQRAPGRDPAALGLVAVPVLPAGGPTGLANRGGGGIAGDDDDCQDFFIMYEEDENGEMDPHTIEVGCAD
jgi:hypothetical protein